MLYSDDPVADFNRYDAEQQKKLEKLPICHECGEHIQQENAVMIYGEWFCDHCLENMRIEIDVDL